MAEQDHEFLVNDEAAELMRLEPQTLAVWRMHGKGPKFIRVGGGPRGKVLYSRKVVLAWLEARTFASTAAEHIAGGAA